MIYSTVKPPTDFIQHIRCRCRTNTSSCWTICCRKIWLVSSCIHFSGLSPLVVISVFPNSANANRANLSAYTGNTLSGIDQPSHVFTGSSVRLLGCRFNDNARAHLFRPTSPLDSSQVSTLLSDVSCILGQISCMMGRDFHDLAWLHFPFIVIIKCDLEFDVLL